MRSWIKFWYFFARAIFWWNHLNTFHHAPPSHPKYESKWQEQYSYALCSAPLFILFEVRSGSDIFNVIFCPSFPLSIRKKKVLISLTSIWFILMVDRWKVVMKPCKGINGRKKKKLWALNIWGWKVVTVTCINVLICLRIGQKNIMCKRDVEHLNRNWNHFATIHNALFIHLSSTLTANSKATNRLKYYVHCSLFTF